MKAVVSSRGACAAASRYRVSVSAVAAAGYVQRLIDDRPQIVHAELEPGDDAEIAAAATDRPEQIRLLIRVDARESAVCRDDVGFDETVDREPEAPAEISHAASERQAPDPRVRHHAGRCHQAVPLARRVDVAEQCAPADFDRSGLRIDDHGVHP